MNKALTSLNTSFLILLFLSLIFSMFSIPNLNIDETQSIKVNFYELIQQDEILFDPRASNTLVKKETNKTPAFTLIQDARDNFGREYQSVSRWPVL